MRLHEFTESNLNESHLLVPFDVNDVSSLPSYITNYFKNPVYFNKEKNIKITVEYMKPDQYIHIAENLLSANYGTATTSRLVTGYDKIKEYARLMQSGTQFPLPYISYIDNLQDGLHRVEAAKQLGITTIPVLVVSRFKANSTNMQEAADSFFTKPTLVRMYHGSNVEFDSFDRARVGDRMTSLGLGHYLSTDKETASRYGKYVMEFNVDTSNMLDWDNLTATQRHEIETALLKVVPSSRIAHFGKVHIEILPRNKAGVARYKELKAKTKDAYNDYAKVRILDDDEIDRLAPNLLNTLDNQVVVSWREGTNLIMANRQQLMTLMNEYYPNLVKDLRYSSAKFANQVAIYDPALAKRVH